MINFTRALGRASAHRRMNVLPPCCRSRRRTICWYTLRTGARMATPLDPVIAQIIPLLPLRDPKMMTPQSARDQLRALAASRAAIPLPPVRSASDTEVKGAAGRLAARLLVYPATDVVGNYADAEQNARFPSRAENAEGYFLSRAVMEWFAGHYLADAKHGADWRVSPLRAKNLAGLAPAVVCTAWFDPLRDEGKAYADALVAAGVATKYHHGAGLIHGYFGLGDTSETARHEAQRARADFKALLERSA